MRVRIAAIACAALCAAAAARADAGKHTVQRGETLEHVAQIYGCPVDAVLRANRLKTTLVRAGTVVRIPTCTVKTNARTRTRARRTETRDDTDRARQALAVIDGATVIASSRGDADDTRDSRTTRAPDDDASRSTGDGDSRSIGAPWRGRLEGGDRLPEGDGYRIRRPHRAYAATHVIDHVQRAIGVVRALYPDVHTLAIGDLSARGGGKLGGHHSHQSGLDIDLGFYFHALPDGYPDRFAPASADLDLEATWALLTAFARTTHLDDGVQIIFLDHAIQARLYRWARKRGTPDDQLAELLQYPRGKDALAGLVRHWPNHADHMHVRFKATHP